MTDSRDPLREAALSALVEAARHVTSTQWPVACLPELVEAIDAWDALASPTPDALDVEALAQIIRTVDGNHDLGAAELAAAILAARGQQ